LQRTRPQAGRGLFAYLGCPLGHLPPNEMNQRRPRRRRKLPDEHGTNTERDSRGRFRPGNAVALGNRGRRDACRIKRRLDAAVTDQDVDEIVRAAVRSAKRGDRHARAFIFDHLRGKPRTAPADPLHVEGLPKIVNEEDAARAAAHLVEQVAAGEVSPDAAAHLARLIQCVRGIPQAVAWTITADGVEAPANPTFI
jgi:hypothetical protein